MGWKVIVFKTAAQRDAWIVRHGQHYQYVEVFVNNAYGLDVRKLRVIG